MEHMKIANLFAQSVGLEKTSVHFCVVLNIVSVYSILT